MELISALSVETILEFQLRRRLINVKTTSKARDNAALFVRRELKAGNFEMTTPDKEEMPTEVRTAGPKPFEVSLDAARVYKVRGGRGCWVEAAIRDWHGGGYLSVQSDFGSFSYGWMATGTATLPEFLIDTEYDYFMGKAHPSRGRRFSFEKTIAKIQADILGERRNGSLEKDEARERIDDLQNMDGAADADVFYAHFLNLDWAHDYCDFSDIAEYVDDAQCRAFWDGPWHALVEYWKAEIASPSAALSTLPVNDRHHSGSDNERLREAENTFGADTDDDVTDWGQENIEENARAARSPSDDVGILRSALKRLLASYSTAIMLLGVNQSALDMEPVIVEAVAALKGVPQPAKPEPAKAQAADSICPGCKTEVSLWTYPSMMTVGGEHWHLYCYHATADTSWSKTDSNGNAQRMTEAEAAEHRAWAARTYENPLKDQPASEAGKLSSEAAK